MANILRSATGLAMHMVKAYAPENGIFVDATCGNGHDTVQLAKLQPRALYAFDIQPQAIEAAQVRLLSEGFGPQLEDGTIRLICRSHTELTAHVKGKANVILFNLGYLPGSDKSCKTTVHTTLPAVKAALGLLSKDGLVCITMYSGHTEGAQEKEALLSFAKELDQRFYHVVYFNYINQPDAPPELLLITSKRDA